MIFPLLRQARIISCAIVLTLGSGAAVYAQSGSRTKSPAQHPAASGASESRGMGSVDRDEDIPVGLDGYCPVCLTEMKQWVKGDPRLAVEFDGQKYLFPGAEQAQMFKADPAKYAPVLEGDDIVHFVRTGERAEGSLAHGVLHNGRSFFFVSVDNKEIFRANPATYEQADLALGGECIVCRVGMNQRVAGRPEFTVVHNGLRYQFPGQEQQAAFSQTPDSYVERVSPRAGTATDGSGTRGSTTSPPRGSGPGSR